MIYVCPKKTSDTGWLGVALNLNLTEAMVGAGVPVSVWPLAPI